MTLTWLGRSGVYIASLAFVLGAARQIWVLRNGKQSCARYFALAGLFGVALSVGVMQFALITHNFSLAFVSENNATFTPLLYSITGMWSALEGSILLWALLLSAYIVFVLFRYRKEAADSVVSWASVVLFIVGAFFTLLMAGPADPFIHNAAKVLQGAGPNALLQDNPLVAIHPPLLYAGFVGFSVPFAFALAMLITGRVQDRWPLELRRWSVLSWGFLTVGIVMGAWWSYEVLGWGGFWGWDPVENAALLPWLTATAYIHSVIVQDRRGLFRVWNLTLAIATFALTILGTFFTRSGVLQSVHAFSSSTLGPILMGFFILTIGTGLALLAWRGDRLRSPVGVDSPFSREGLFVANNILFVGFAIVVLLGTVFPLLFQAINGGQVTVGTPYFATVAAPLSVALLVLMALAPLVSWRTSDRRVLWERLRFTVWISLLAVLVMLLSGVRKPVVLVAYFLAIAAAGSAFRLLRGTIVSAHRRGESFWSALRGPTTGGMVVHLGVVIMAIGIVTSTSYTTRADVTLARAQSTYVAGQKITFDGFRQVSDSLRTATDLEIVVNNHELMQPAITTFNGRDGQTVGTPAIDSNPWRDVYLTFDAVGGNGAASGAQVAGNLPAGSVVVGVTVEPLISWLWAGGLIVGLGSALSFFRRRHKEEVSPT
jgi:cytochrome c-type biogenesis protein CcmF